MIQKIRIRTWGEGEKAKMGCGKTGKEVVVAFFKNKFIIMAEKGLFASIFCLLYYHSL